MMLALFARGLRRMASALVVLALGFACMGCLRYMRTTARPMLTPARGRAQVVFLCPEGGARPIAADVFDDSGRFLGEVASRSYFVVEVAPGHHTFVIWSRNTDGLSADVAADRVYFIRIQRAVARSAPASTSSR